METDCCRGSSHEGKSSSKLELSILHIFRRTAEFTVVHTNELKLMPGCQIRCKKQTKNY